MSDTPIGSEVLVVAKARSGASLGRADRVPDVQRRMPGATVHRLGEDETLDDVVAAAVADDSPPRVLAILGGDGSVSRAAHLARRHDLTLLVLPNGTFNHFARSAGIEDVDAGLDAYPEFLAERERRTSLGKWWGGAVAAWREVHGAHPVDVVRGGKRARVWSVFAGVGRNDPDHIATMQRATLHDAVIDVRVHHARGSRLRAVASLAFGKNTVKVLRALRVMPPASDLERILEDDFELEVAAGSAPDIWVHDGELEEVGADGFRMRVRAVADGLRVYLPAADG